MARNGRNMKVDKPNKLPRKPIPPYKIGDMVKVYQNHAVITHIQGPDYYLTLFIGGAPFVVSKQTYGIFWE